MIKFKKYAIIMCIVGVISILHSFNIFASENELGPGEHLEENSIYRITGDGYCGSNANEFWAEWAMIHFGNGVDVRLKPGDSSYSDVIVTNRIVGKTIGQGNAKGYGLYQFLLEKHMVGYLYYIKIIKKIVTNN